MQFFSISSSAFHYLLTTLNDNFLCLLERKWKTHKTTIENEGGKERWWDALLGNFYLSAANKNSKKMNESSSSSSACIINDWRHFSLVYFSLALRSLLAALSSRCCNEGKIRELNTTGSSSRLFFNAALSKEKFLAFNYEVLQSLFARCIKYPYWIERTIFTIATWESSIICI